MADVSVIVVDARQGVTAGTRRHGFFAALLAVRTVVLAVNKIDLVDDAQAAFGRIAEDFRKLAAQLGLPSVACVPIAAESGDNVGGRAPAMPWYTGPTLVELLEHVEPLPGGAGAAPVEVADQFEATIFWLNEAPLLRGRSYLIKIGDARRSPRRSAR